MNTKQKCLIPVVLGVLTVLTVTSSAHASGPAGNGGAVSSAGNSETALEAQQKSLGGGTGVVVEYGHLRPEATPDPATGQIPPPGLLRVAPPDPVAASPTDTTATPAPAATLLTDRTSPPLAREIRAAGEDAPPKEAADWGKPLAILAALAGLVVLGVRLWGQRLDAELQGRGIRLDD